LTTADAPTKKQGTYWSNDLLKGNISDTFSRGGCMNPDPVSDTVLENSKARIKFSWHDIHWPTAIFLTLIPLLAVIMTPIHISLNGLDWRLILFFVVLSIVTSMSITAGYHRLISHLSYSAHPAVKFLVLFFGAGAFQGSALKWCTDHRRHHTFVDSEKDPYSIRRGFFYAHIGWLFTKDDPRFANNFAPDLLKDSMMVFQHRYYYPLAFAVGFGIPLLLGWSVGAPWGGLIYAGILRIVFTHHTTFLINSACHFFGKQTYGEKNSARDSHLISFFTFGEGYHNFHHHFQYDYRNGIRWYDWDPTKWSIMLAAVLGLASRLKTASHYEILRARLEVEQKRLLQTGASAQYTIDLRKKVEEAQKRWLELKKEYQLLKSNWQLSSRTQLIQFKKEVRQARVEFKIAFTAWMSLYNQIS
jgi:stearoyl-CoA desaturase (delta-9 desaturase)